MGEYDRTGNGQNGEADWDLRSILCDMAKNWWIILLIACSAAMITYTVLTAVHRDQYTVKTTFAVMGRGENANAASSLSSTYEMTQKFQAILENNILKKKVMEESDSRLVLKNFEDDSTFVILDNVGTITLVGMDNDGENVYFISEDNSLYSKAVESRSNPKRIASKVTAAVSTSDGLYFLQESENQQT